ncbi:MAG: polysaccharide deacetylase family protein [Saprospiraceae bacterium]|nr:polysaccharide deacetylase family protein [Saprospiraceae bacterium]
MNILYHGVVRKDSSFFSPRHIPIEQFERHLKYFRKNFEIISIQDAFNNYRNNIVPKKKTITISFDDGYQNNLNTALPLLEKYNIPTSFFILGSCTDNHSDNLLWTDKIACFELFFKNESIEYKNNLFIDKKEINSNKSMKAFLKTLKANERDNIVNDIYIKYNLSSKIKEIDKEIWQLMNKEEIIKLASSDLVDIGSHGYNHYNLGVINLQDAIDDMKKSKTVLEETISKPVTMIAYPDGDYSIDVKVEALKIGFKEQLAVNYIYNEDIDDKTILNRHGIPATTTYESSMIFLNKAFKDKSFN